MRTIKIAFSDFYDGFDPVKSKYYCILKKYYDVQLSENPEFLFYSCFGARFLKYENCIRIFWTGENVRPNFNECDYAIGFDYMTFEDRYIRDSIFIEKKLDDNFDYFNRKFCNFVYSNGNLGMGAAIRKDFCKLLAKYKHIDCPGKILNNMKEAIEPRYKNWWKSKQDFLKNYKFTIAFENSSSPGYTTEKLHQPLWANSIPIYWGDPVVERVFNPKAIINCHNFPNFEAVVDYVKYLDTHRNSYLDILYAPAMNPLYRTDNLDEFLLHIIEHGTIQRDDQRSRLYGNPAYNSSKDLCNNIVNYIICPFTYGSNIDINLTMAKVFYNPTKTYPLFDQIIEQMINNIGQSNYPEQLTIGKYKPELKTGRKPLKFIPEPLMRRFSMSGAIPVQNWYFDQRPDGPKKFSDAHFNKVKDRMARGTLEYSNASLSYIKQVMETYDIRDKDVLIYGIRGPYVEAFCLCNGAKNIFIADLLEHGFEPANMLGISLERLAEKFLGVDIAISMAWTAHMGLGRYGDPLDPDGDVAAMKSAYSQLKPGGLLFVSVPLGKDALIWNAHRIYGPKRLPLLLEGWEFIDVIGCAKEAMFEHPYGDCSFQPVLILRK